MAQGRDLLHIVVLGSLLVVLLVVLVKFGYMRCSAVPGLCDIYYRVMGQPKILIIYEDNADKVFITKDYELYGIQYPYQEFADEKDLDELGIGNATRLRDEIAKVKYVYPAMADVDDVLSAGLLHQYDLVIVEGAKKIPTETLRAIEEYARQGGKLVWVGNAGTVLDVGKGDTLCKLVKYDIKCGYYEQMQEVTNPFSRAYWEGTAEYWDAHHPDYVTNSYSPIKAYCKRGTTPQIALAGIRNETIKTMDEWYQLLNTGKLSSQPGTGQGYQQYTDEYGTYPSGFYEQVQIDMQNSSLNPAYRNNTLNFSCTINLTNPVDLSYVNPWIRGPQDRGEEMPEQPEVFYFSDVLSVEWLGDSFASEIKIPQHVASNFVTSGMPPVLDFYTVLGESLPVAVVYPYQIPKSLSGSGSSTSKLINELAIIELSKIRHETNFTTNQTVMYVDETGGLVVRELSERFPLYGNTFPAIFETRYSTKVLFFAFPPEQVNSSTLISNLIDYMIY